MSIKGLEGADCAWKNSSGTAGSFKGAGKSAFMEGGVDEWQFEFEGEFFGLCLHKWVFKLL